MKFFSSYEIVKVWGWNSIVGFQLVITNHTLLIFVLFPLFAEKIHINRCFYYVILLLQK